METPNFNTGKGKELFEASVEQETKMGYYYRKFILQNWVYPFIEQGKNLHVVDLGCGSGTYLNSKITEYIKNDKIQKLYLVDGAPNMCDAVVHKTEQMDLTNRTEVWQGNIASWFIPIDNTADMQRVYTPLEKLRIKSEIDRINKNKIGFLKDFPNQKGDFSKITWSQETDLVTMFGLVHYLNPNEVFRLLHNLMYMLKPETGRAIFSIAHPVLYPESFSRLHADSFDWGFIKITKPQSYFEKNRVIGASFLDIGFENVSLSYKMEHRTKSGNMEQPFFYHNCKLYYLMCQYLGLEITRNYIDLVDSSRCSLINGQLFGYPTVVTFEIKSKGYNFYDRTGYDRVAFDCFCHWARENYNTNSVYFLDDYDMNNIDFSPEDGWDPYTWKQFCKPKLYQLYNQKNFNFEEFNREEFIIKTYQEYVEVYATPEFKQRMQTILNP